MRPSGTVTFLFTDIEGSTHLWETHPEQMQLAFARQEQILRRGIESFGGYPYKMIGDAFQAAFSTTSSALQAAVEIQRALNAQSWGETPIRVRMALHAGVAEERGDDYVGPVLNRPARLLAAGYGGQILLTQAAADLVADQLPNGIELKDLGVHFLKDLVRPEHIYQAVAPGLPVDFPPLKTIDTRPNNLPLQLTSFIGREKEMARLHQLFSHEETRLVTLTGPGGTGKTRLSLQFGAELLDRFSDGCWFVELAPLADADRVPNMVATVLDIRDVPDKPIINSLIAFIRNKKMLLILDNCEHLVEACARMTDDLLRACPGLVILSSSREIFGIDGEVTFRVPSLSIPDMQHLPDLENLIQYESVRLFVERAQTALPDFTLTQENIPWIAQIVSRLDGIPLAIELAAARVRLLSPIQIANRLDDAFRLLTGGSRVVLPRHQTLRALIDWSYELLSPKERTLLRRLSVFPASWTLEAAEEICSSLLNDLTTSSNEGELISIDVFDLIRQLVDKSLVNTLETNSSILRYRMMETIRQYANEKLVELKESGMVREQHMKYFLQLVETAEPFLRTREQVTWLNQLEGELDNLRLALEWSLEKDSESELRLSSALMWFWKIRGPAREGIRWLQKGLSKMPALSEEIASASIKAIRAKALLALGALMSQHETAHQALPYLEESLSIYQSLGEPGNYGAAYACRWMAIGFRRTGDHERANSLVNRAIELFTRQNNRFGLSESLQLLARPQDAPGEAKQIYLKVLSLNREIGDIDGMAFTLQMLSQLAFREGDYPQALQWLDESLRCFREVGNRRFTATDLRTQATIYWAMGNYLQGIQSIDEALIVSRDTDDQRQYQMNLLRKGDILISSGDAASAKNVVEEALQEAQARQDPLAKGFALVSMGKIECVEGKFDQAQEYWKSAESIGEEIHHWPLVHTALLWQGKVALWQGNIPQAARLLSKSLERRIMRSNRVNLAYPLEVYASLALQQMSFEKAARLFGAAETLFPYIRFEMSVTERAKHDQALAATEAALGEEAFAAAWVEGKRMSLEQAVDYAVEDTDS